MRLSFPDFKIDNCGQAGVKVYDGPPTSANFKAEHCGSSAPEDYLASGNQVTMNVSAFN